MAVLPPIRRLLLEDFASQRSWIEPLLLIENIFAESVVNALNKGLTMKDNTTGDIITLPLTSLPTASNPALCTWTKASTPVAVTIGQVAIGGGVTPTLTAAPGLQWAMNGRAIQVSAIYGISNTPSPSAPIILTLVVHAG